MRFGEVQGRPVMDTTSARQVAEVAGFVVRPREARITAVRLGKVHGKGRMIDWTALKAFGVDAVTVEGTGGFREPADEHERRAVKGDLDLEGRPLLTDQGRLVGTVVDVEFDPITGSLTGLLLDGDDEAVAGERLIGAGSHAVVVRDRH